MIHRSRVYIYSELVGRGEIVTFPIDGVRYELAHDELVRIIGETTPFLESRSWRERGIYHTAKPSAKLLAALAQYRVGDDQ